MAVVLLAIFVTNIFTYEIYLDATKYKQDFDKIIISSDDIKNFSDLGQVFRYYNIDVYTRSGAQYDFSLNGGSFEQVKILLNGIPINDPQTGHHNCNLVLSNEDIDYIEITKMDNFTKFGNTAFSGVINIIPKTYSKTRLGFLYGSFNTTKISLNLPFSCSYLSLEVLNSDGFRENTDYNSFNIFYYSKFKDSTFTAGFLEKKFGAQDFYTPPSTRKEYEHTKTLLFSFSKKFFMLDTDLFFRSGYDFYTTNRDNPQVYSNYHNSYLYGVNLKTETFYNNVTIQPILEFLTKQLDSKGFSSLFPWYGMGKFFDYEFRCGSNFMFNFNKNFQLETTLSGSYYSRYQFIPQFGGTLKYFPAESTKFFVSVSQVHRVPSYTELYYWDPSHQGSEELKVEKTFMSKAGFEQNFNKLLNISISGFKYEPFDIIDWVRTKNTSKWYVTNITKAQVYGCNLSLKLNYKNFVSNIFYTFTEKYFDVDENKELKYVDNYPKHNLSMNFSLLKFFGFELSFFNNYRYLTKTQPKEVLLSSVVLSRTIKSFEVKTSIENLFNIKYEELPGVEAPPQSFKFSINLYL